jgi:uncharacterized damage-inducible protein DinB
MAGRRRTSRSGSGPLTPAQARAIVRYNRRVFDRYVRRLERLPLRRATKNRETGHLTWIATFSHILNVHEAWMIYVVPGRVQELRARFKDTDRHPSTWPGLDRYAKLVFDGVEQWSRTASPSELARPVRAPWMPGRYTVSDALMQTTLEQAHHLGEVIATLWQEDTAPPAMTWIELTRPPLRRG